MQAVFWDEFPEGLVDDGKCIFVHGPRLHALLHGRPNRLSRDDVEEIAAAVAAIASREPADQVVATA